MEETACQILSQTQHSLHDVCLLYEGGMLTKEVYLRSLKRLFNESWETCEMCQLSPHCDILRLMAVGVEIIQSI